MFVRSQRPRALRRTLAKAALVGTAVAATLSLTAVDANAGVGAGTTAGYFTLSQPDWSTNTAVWDNGYELIFQSDGNLVLYNSSGTALWASGTWGIGVTDLDFSSGGYIALKYSNGTNACTMGALNPAPGGLAQMQDDGNFVFYNTGGGATWATGTYLGAQGNTDYCYT